MLIRLAPARSQDVSALREERRRSASLGIVPLFYSRLVDEARAHVVEEYPAEGTAGRVLGYVLTLERPHVGHSHVTAIEVNLEAGLQDRYEDVLDLIRDELHPTAYLTRTDDCQYNATLLSRGLQVEPTALVMLRKHPAATAGRAPSGVAPLGPASLGVASLGAASSAAKPQTAGVPASPSQEAITIAPISQEHVQGIAGGLDPQEDAEMLSDLEAMATSGRGWAVIDSGKPVAAIARRDGGDGLHELLDFAFARAAEPALSWALQKAAQTVEGEGLRPAGVIDATEAARHRIFRGAGFFTTSSYLVYYDPVAGRPSVARITTAELHGMIERGEQFRLVDVLGEDHWKDGHIPGSEWIDFRGLAREARRRFKPDEPVVVYCSGFT